MHRKLEVTYISESLSSLSHGRCAGGSRIRPSFGRFEFFASSIISLRERKYICKHSKQILERETLPSESPDPTVKLVHGVIRVGLFVVDHVKIARLTALER